MALRRTWSLPSEIVQCRSWMAMFWVDNSAIFLMMYIYNGKLPCIYIYMPYAIFLMITLPSSDLNVAVYILYISRIFRIFLLTAIMHFPARLLCLNCQKTHVQSSCWLSDGGFTWMLAPPWDVMYSGKKSSTVSARWCLPSDHSTVCDGSYGYGPFIGDGIAASCTYQEQRVVKPP